jgi:hypothetical protein
MCKGNILKGFVFICLIVFMNGLIMLVKWPSIFLSLVIFTTYFFYRPVRLFHPNNMIFAFYGLYVIMPSTLNYILDVINWEYVLPWGKVIFWDRFSLYSIFQIELTFLILFFSFLFFSNRKSDEIKTFVNLGVSNYKVSQLYFATFMCVAAYIVFTGGVGLWINDYSNTFTYGRSGYGWLNLIIMTLGNALVFFLGLLNYKIRMSSNNKYLLLVVIFSFIAIFFISYVQGFKSRLIFLIMLFYFPYIVNIRLSFYNITKLVLAFFILLYITTMVRTDGFYSSYFAFIEYLVGYFDSFQLHDNIVRDRDPDFLTTYDYIFNKHFQLIGLSDGNLNTDLGVTLTKEYYPEIWHETHATKEWPLDTELYLNLYGLIFGWLVLVPYAYITSKIYSLAILKSNSLFMLIYLMEFLRIFIVLRGSIIPWNLSVVLVEYIVIYFISKGVATYEIRNN